MLEDAIMLNQTKNGDELIKATSDFPAIIVITCMLSIFSVVGTTGNAFVLYVFSRKKDKNTSTVFILALASIDFVTCIFVIPFTIFVEFLYKKIDNDAVCKIYQFFITSNVPFSAFIMVAIAFDRYFCICRPWMKFINIRVAKRIIICLLLLAVMLGLITSLAYGVYHRKIIGKVMRNVSEPDNVNATLEQVSIESVVLLTNCSSGIRGSLVGTTTGSVNCSDNLDVLSKLPRRTRPSLVQLSPEYSTPVPIKPLPFVNDFVFTGFCFPNEVILSIAFKRVYQKFYASLFLIAFVIVFILYALIYKSILTRRSKRLQTSLTEKRTGRMRTAMLASIFSRKPRTQETFIMVANNADVNKNNQENANVNALHSTRTVAIEARIPIVSEITFCAQESYKTETTRATSFQSIAHSALDNDADDADDASDAVNERLDDEKAPLNAQESKLNFTTNNLRIPEPPVRAKRKRNNKNGNICFKNNEQNKNTNNRGLPNGCEQSATDVKEHRSSKDKNRATSCNVYRQDTRKSVREKHRVANIKTAGILFIVTIVFIIAFLPAWLMATKLIPPNMIVFYTYFIYNVANPVIYAFFNQSFQKEMKTVLKCASEY